MIYLYHVILFHFQNSLAINSKTKFLIFDCFTHQVYVIIGKVHKSLEM